MSFYRQGPNRSYGSGARFGVPGLTPMVKILLITCGAVWVLQLLLEIAVRFSLIPWLGVIPALVIRGFVWQPFTYMFLHSTAGIGHLLFNMLLLWFLGGDLERHWGSRAFLRYYLVCGVGAGIIITVLGLFSEQGRMTPTIGASGAIYGVILAFGMIFGERIILFMFMFPMKARTFAWILFAVAFFSSLTGQSSGVSHIGHLGGMVVGYLYLKRAWRFGEFYRELKWKLTRRKFKVVPKDDDRWVN
jgi:membrane associated rhomboid family serine protease